MPATRRPILASCSRTPVPAASSPRLFEVYAAHKAAADSYEPRPAEGDFTLITARDGAWPEAWLRNAWAGLVEGRFIHRVVEGDRWSVLREPHVDALASEILGLLRVAQQHATALPACLTRAVLPQIELHAQHQPFA
jgi:thioesterase domain-containing protein